jgi:hypothetical protein
MCVGVALVPLTLISHHVLAVLTNAYLDAFNELRECAALSLAVPLATHLHSALVVIAGVLSTFHQRHHRTFDQVSPLAIICSKRRAPSTLASSHPTLLFLERIILLPGPGPLVCLDIRLMYYTLL